MSAAMLLAAALCPATPTSRQAQTHISPASLDGGSSDRPAEPVEVAVVNQVVEAVDDDLTATGKADSSAGRIALLTSNHPAILAVRLSDDDVRHYRSIFDLQTAGKMEAADAEMAQLHDRRLMGPVLRQRYLHRGAGKVDYEDLRLWLKRYSDQAGAARIRALAEARQPKGARPPPDLPDFERMNSAGLEEKAARGDGVITPRTRPVMGRLPDSPVTDRVDTYLRTGRVSAALKVLGDDGQTRRLNSAEYDALRARIAAALFFEGDHKAALSLAAASASRSGAAVPGAHWIAGLAAWCEGNFAAAGRHFEAMAANPGLMPRDAAAAAYWAARVRVRLDDSKHAEYWLNRAARYDRTFYGQIAGRTLGRTAVFQWQVPPLTAHHLVAIADTKAGSRAIALLQVGQDDLAEQELRRIKPRDNSLLAEALVALADQAGLPALALQVGDAVASPDGGAYDAALYPLPHWTPPEGFTLDKALLFAIMRQESRFEPRLISRAGATGVMQLMPETARDVDKELGGTGGEYDGHDRRRLFDPQWNLKLAQRYVGMLLASPQVSGNLLHLAAAYNAGPSNLMRWRHDMEGIGDPLLFIESIPMRETRDYVHKVLANYWIYQNRLGQPTTTLHALAAGNWPLYVPDGEKTTQVAVRVEN
ncbi:MAG: lytic transglycosylase domain-containing protein [Rhodospirillaceae bacterium]